MCNSIRVQSTWLIDKCNAIIARIEKKREEKWQQEIAEYRTIKKRWWQFWLHPPGMTDEEYKDYAREKIYMPNGSIYDFQRFLSCPDNHLYQLESKMEGLIRLAKMSTDGLVTVSEEDSEFLT